MNIQSKIAAGVTTGVVLLSMVATSTFAAGSTVQGNLKNSVNIATTNNNWMYLLGQSNNHFVVVGVSNNNNTGGNKSNDNLGGGQTVKGGNANNNTNINVGGGTNLAATPACGCMNMGDSATIQGNGKNSLNMATVNNNSFTGISQSNSLVSITSVDNNNNTGGNKANDNLGGGQSVHSGDASSNTNINVGGGTNVLLP